MNSDMQTESLPHYELTVLLKGEEGMAQVKSILQKHGVAIQEEKEAQKARFAYTLKKEQTGFVYIVHFVGDPASVALITGDLQLIPIVLRSLIHRVSLKDHSREGAKVSETKKPEGVPERKRFFGSSSSEPKKPVEAALTNEALEKTIKDILK